MRDGESKEDIFREVKYGIEHLEWEIENKQQDIEYLKWEIESKQKDIEHIEWEIESKQKELKEKKEWLEDIFREPDWDNIGTERRLGCK